MSEKRKVRKAVFPVAGLGTRFLPATKAVPKEMLTVVDKPVIQYVVDEAIEAGIEHLIFVTGRGKGVIEDYFDIQTELEQTLRERNKTAELTLLADILPKAGMASFTRQQAPLGLGHAVWCARDIVGDEPFAVLLPDMIMRGEKGCLKGMVELYEQSGGNVLAVEECAPEVAHKYGIVGVGETIGEGFAINAMVEKPAAGTAPSNYFINGRYILQPEIFNILETQERGAGNEIQLTDGMLKLLKSQDFAGYVFRGETYDCGAKDGFILANVAFALSRDDIRGSVEGPLKALLAR
ncbi:UDP-glucose pyrophosphorylase [Rhizobium sp. PP-F2F-G38]|uniref:UTP--glucose-1-phosphate uridylyltransferase n=1 Tax=Ferranicluibacter rubi TaxID=2715133 RepID=A0AA44CC84_9HYPH|nr:MULTISPECIES: UTP--glucose-1-phosphate uridylyltransferase GalU [Rhizobiaceae]PYE24557.1 UDP-glucose pyrophosphorylase [Rhizobium sp. PP-CC-3A-592]PYE33496.1 UDP-glucose pyrophosphorylase [Rhizobium sp. PP-WC-1G-195]PYE41706.1 UDP-glucose pyrophosphorylase [Rhizobium sp. PP-F2F-G20b]PYE98246.1 UDP-glucose pyrophosphorylase [Rhizobium sp. PP-F2F-G38]TCP83470.1 UDP-glucose pyrophosphorylase [Rhizobium sp. PP-CC-2G-626]TCQ07783.1 UDP-glucose pyrophosphorylase [Rhizobium sp. PP-F2F-G36]TCQ209